MRACDEGVMFFPVYAMLFADAGLSTAQITSLFIIWSGTALLLEVPSGAWADTFSRRRMLAFGALIRACGFAVWVIWPTYTGFAIGFVLWSVRSAISSGTKEALLYDELAAYGATDRYAYVSGRAATIALISMLATTALAAPALAWGGYPLIAIGSIFAGCGSAVAALSFPERPSSGHAQSVQVYLANLRAGVTEMRHDRVVRHAVLIAAAVPALAALDEYVPLLVRDLGVVTTGVPLIIAVIIVAMAVGSWLAGRWHDASAQRIGWLVILSGVTLSLVAWQSGLAGLIPVAVCFGLMQLTRILTETRLQEAMSGQARATVLSIAGFGAELGTVGIYGIYAFGSLGLDIGTLIALTAVPIVLLGWLAMRWLPSRG